MSRETDVRHRSQCTNCGFESESGGWDAVEAPPLGEMTQCPECGSTNVTTRR